MIVYSSADYFYGNSYDTRDTTREIFVLIPTALVVFYYCSVFGAFGESVRKGAKNVIRVPVLIVSKNTNALSDKKKFNAANRFCLYDAEAHSCLKNYKLVPYSKQTALIKACSGTYPIYNFERIKLPDSHFIQKYKSVYYLSGTSSKFEKKFFLLLFERRSDALKVLKKTLEVFRAILDLLGDDFCFNQTKSIYSKVEYMYNPIALFAQGLAGWKWCRAFVGGLIKGVVDASEVSSDFLIGKDFEIVRWD